MNTQDALQKLETLPPERQQQPMDLLQLAVEKGATVETMERLMAVRRELLAEQAKSAYFDSLAKFQAECPMIVKSVAGHENRYHYAPLDQIIRDVTPYLLKHGFSHQENAVVTDQWVEALVTITHRQGHSETKSFKVPAETKAGMSPQQKFGAALTYATRYAFCLALGLRTAEKDTDCAPTADGPEAVAALKQTLWSLLRGVRGTEKNWTAAQRWLWDECVMDPDQRVQDLDAAGFRTVIGKAKEKLGVSK